MFLFSQPFLWTETAAGERIVSWRAWVLLWVVPALFAVAALILLAAASYRQLSTVPGEGEVVRVYAWDGETIFDRGSINYSPVFRYEFAPGDVTEATSGMSHPGWNFEIGSRHAIRYNPRRKTDVVLPGAHNWAPAAVIAALALLTGLPAIWGHRRLRRWQRGGKR
ncbi:DUF3592 domain-containing protein [Marimonas arenosa]|uniref:DUF3592 domain-containing protein n=1 Tax=Marimonas arenosa TaxID=1795305 RepID=A0AAE3W926_9RHOB|nr:DUF3592 domain-containing protein [Marimonas arenosa]MDQ2088464.1 hypothetical protein [Marimonas arenosa]